MIRRDAIDEMSRLAPSPSGVEVCSCDEALALRRELAAARARIAELEGRGQSGHTRVILETPYAGDVGANLAYLRACMRDCLRRGEAPFASHGLYTQPGVLRDDDPAERDLGIRAGFAWRPHAARTVVYTDRGISSGMQRGIDHAVGLIWQEVEYRTLEGGARGKG